MAYWHITDSTKGIAKTFTTLSSMYSNLLLFTRDISQSYVQSKTSTQRLIYVRSPVALELSKETLLRIELPLHKITEAGLHWYCTYHKHSRKYIFIRPYMIHVSYTLSKECQWNNRSPMLCNVLSVFKSMILHVQGISYSYFMMKSGFQIWLQSHKNFERWTLHFN